MENLYDYLLHFNSYTGYWNAFKREDSVDYFNGKLENQTEKELIKSKNVNDIIKWISKGK